ncbi:hypothetical protein ACF0H5_007871 [Mactra antiquata]
MPVKVMECGPKCRSKKHSYELNCAISKGSLEEIQKYMSVCYNGGQVCDIHGRSALHMAAACGKRDVVEWLLESISGDVTQKDNESGWTALHRALFYGNLATARLLVLYKSDMYTRDHEGLGPLDITMKDRSLLTGVPPPVYEISDNHEVYTWGDNSNFTLGHKTEQGRNYPEVIDEFRKKHIAIQQVVMCKYHTVFLSSDGTVYTCGHGMGGRLGHSNEETCLVPKQIDSLKTEVCTEIAAARDHTVILAKSCNVYSCGMNMCHQLGQFPPPEQCLVPRIINSKTIKGKQVIGISTGRFHTIVYTSSAVFSCGLNAGQLGHPKPKGDRKISQLKQVSWLNGKDITVVSVKCSDASTVVLTSEGEIYVLHEYQCRKMASNRPGIQRLCVVGGNLDHTDSQILRENGGRQLVISFLHTSGKVFIWHEKSPSLKRAHWLIKRQLDIKDFILTENGIAIVTELGEVFVCTLLNKPTPVRETSNVAKESVEGEFGRMSLLDLLMKEETEDVQVRKVANIHRATYITADRKGRNFTTFQSLPNCSLTDVPSISYSIMTDCFSTLLEEADEYDLIHDLILQINDQRWPVHKYILVNRCANFPNLLVNNAQTLSDSSIPIIDVQNIHPQILGQLLLYVYTDTCDLLNIGAKFELSDDVEASVSEEIFHLDLHEGQTDGNVNTNCNKRMSAYEAVLHGKDKRRKSDKSKSDKDSNGNERNPVKLLIDVAKKWGVKGLAKKLGCVTYKKGKICSAGKPIQKQGLRFDRNKLKDSKWELYDVSIKSEDGVIFQCHKCILVARLEYFHSMLASGWMETSTTSDLSLPVPGDILEILLDYLYTDESQVINGTQNVELLCNILVVADQMLVVRLKEICEASIAVLVTLKNVGELLEFSTMYNASQLKSTCQQFIALNLAALIEGRYLDVLSDDTIDELTRYYRDAIPNMSRRMITPYDEGPEKSYLEYLASINNEDSEHPVYGVTSEQKKGKSKRKRNRTKSSTEEQEKGSERGQRKASTSEEQEKGPERGQKKASISEDQEKGSEREQRKLSTTEDKEKGSGRGKRKGSERHLSISSDISVKSDNEVIDEMKELNVDCSNNAVTSMISKSPSTWNNVTPGIKSPKPSNVLPQWRNTVETSPIVTVSNTNSPSLRDIMNEEETKISSKKNSSSQKGGKISWKEVKKQQSVQRAQQQGQTKGHTDSSSDKDNHDKNEAQSKSPGIEKGTCPWGSMNKVVSSFRSLMVEDEKVNDNRTTTTKPLSMVTRPKLSSISKHEEGRQASQHSKVVSWGLPQSNQKSSLTVKTSPVSTSPSKNAWNVEPSSPRSPDSVWIPSIQSPSDNICKFTDIVKDEQQKTDVLTKNINKPLSLIQIEEQAMQDLLKFYQADENVDEHITVERVQQASATPVWKRERVQST